MAEFTDRIKLVFDAVTNDASSNVGKLKEGVAQSEGAFGKLKSAAGGAISAITASPVALAGAGLAIGKVAFDLASAFTDAALSANDFADATGLSVEQASRWQEVAGDVGVSTETLEGAVNKLNIAAGKGALRDLGIGGADTNEQLLNALQHIQSIPDAATRAQQGVQIFGKSWTSLAPLVETAGDLRQALADVSDGQVIDEEEVAKAKRMRDALDTLGDQLENFKLQVGGELAGALGDFATGLGNVTTSLGALGEAIPNVGDAFDIALSPLRNVSDGFATLTDSSLSLTDRARGLGQTITGSIPGPLGSWASGLFDVSDAQDDAAASAEATAAAAQAQAQAANDAEAATRAWSDAILASFNSNLALADAADRTEEAIGKYDAAAASATEQSWGNAEANKAARAAMNDAEQAALGQAAAAVKLKEDQAKANDEVLTAGQRNGIMADSLRTTAGTMAPGSPLRKNLEDYAQDLDKIPESAHTVVTADTADAEEKVDSLLRNILALVLRPFNVHVGATTSAPSPGAAAAPSGVGVAGMALGASQTGLGSPVSRAAPSGSGSVTINNYVSVAPFTSPAEVGRAIADHLDAFYRGSGRRLRPVA